MIQVLVKAELILLYECRVCLLIYFTLLLIGKQYGHEDICVLGKSASYVGVVLAVLSLAVRLAEMVVIGL